ncbi:MAG: two-component system LytT family sensor kinase, partial [Phenylobacterium sp.]
MTYTLMTKLSLISPRHMNLPGPLKALRSTLRSPEVLSHILFWLIMFALPHNVRISTDIGPFDSTNPQYSLIGIGLNMLVFYVNYLVLIPRYMNGRMGVYLLSVMVMLFSITALEIAIDKFTLGDIPGLSTQEVIKALLLINLAMHIIYWLFSVIMRLGRDWFINQHIQKTIKAEHTQTELALLKSQVHPHFLFNTLNTLYSSSYNYGDQETAEGIGKLSHLLRYMLYETKDEQVALDNETEYLQNYIDLQTMRFTDDVTISFSIEGETDDITVAPMLFITLVENAFKHGISPARHATIDIVLSIEAGKMTLTVENDIHPQRAKSILESKSESKSEGDAGGLGLDNLKRRLALLYPQRHELVIIEDNKRFKTRLELT